MTSNLKSDIKPFSGSIAGSGVRNIENSRGKALKDMRLSDKPRSPKKSMTDIMDFGISSQQGEKKREKKGKIQIDQMYWEVYQNLRQNEQSKVKKFRESHMKQNKQIKLKSD